jgi:hypothetical protein
MAIGIHGISEEMRDWRGAEYSSSRSREFFPKDLENLGAEVREYQKTRGTGKDD